MLNNNFVVKNFLNTYTNIVAYVLVNFQDADSCW